MHCNGPDSATFDVVEFLGLWRYLVENLFKSVMYIDFFFSIIFNHHYKHICLQKVGIEVGKKKIKI